MMTLSPAVPRPDSPPHPAPDPGRLHLPPFEAVLAAHQIEIYRYLRRLAPTAEEAADLHQETFLRAFRAYGRLTPDANVRAWLFRIAGNLARDAHRRRLARSRGGAVRSLDGATELPGGAGTDPVQAAVDGERWAAIRAGLLGLTWRQRTAVVGRILDGLDYAELAAVLDCSEPTARQHVSQGLRRLRASLDEPEDPR